MTTKNYDIVFEANFVATIGKHYHGDYGMLFSTSADNGRTIWQCACGYRVVTSGAININLKESIDSYIQSNTKLIYLADNPTIHLPDEESLKKRKEAFVEWMTRGNYKDHGNIKK